MRLLDEGGGDKRTGWMRFAVWRSTGRCAVGPSRLQQAPPHPSRAFASCTQIRYNCTQDEYIRTNGRGGPFRQDALGGVGAAADAAGRTLPPAANCAIIGRRGWGCATRAGSPDADGNPSSRGERPTGLLSGRPLQPHLRRTFSNAGENDRRRGCHQAGAGATARSDHVGGAFWLVCCRRSTCRK